MTPHPSRPTIGIAPSKRRGPGAGRHDWRGRDPAPDRALVDTALAALVAVHPALKGIGVAEAWGSTIYSAPDTIPVITAVGELPDLFLATGFSGHGFGIGSAVERLAADVVTGSRCWSIRRGAAASAW